MQKGVAGSSNEGEIKEVSVVDKRMQECVRINRNLEYTTATTGESAFSSALLPLLLLLLLTLLLVMVVLPSIDNEDVDDGDNDDDVDDDKGGVGNASAIGSNRLVPCVCVQWK